MYVKGTHNGLNAVDITKKQINSGKKLLSTLKLRGQKAPYRDEEKVSAAYRILHSQCGPLGKYTTLDNLRSIVVQENGKGSWYADVILKHVPEGWPDTIGSPSHIPLNNRKQALQWAYLFVRDLQFMASLDQHGADVLSEIPGFQRYRR